MLSSIPQLNNLASEMESTRKTEQNRLRVQKSSKVNKSQLCLNCVLRLAQHLPSRAQQPEGNRKHNTHSAPGLVPPKPGVATRGCRNAKNAILMQRC
ncbi:hypothetical protein L195_g004084 [Trifolium pratense]|uniref:Uncharacterized protein n=1 Tax=Trifolium pratense TaxID=57577 RepID=A0A2K3NX42_TRIPR|nr:hypothetical protein L195_g004084 [Trifolium pratense]